MNLTGKFLIAMPAMKDPFFEHSLIYVCEHNAEGALGLILNRPTELTVGSLYEKIDLGLQNPAFQDQPVYFGGPVQTDHGFVLHRPLGNWQSTLRVDDNIGLTSSRDVLESLATGPSPMRSNDMLVMLGYTGWGAMQLEHEIRDNSWLSLDASATIIFDTEHEARAPAAMAMLGFDYSQLSGVAGHA